MLVRALNLTEKSSLAFNDVKSTDWYADAVAAAVKAGIVQGTSASQFGAKASITREEMVTMLMRGYEKLHGKPGAGTGSTFNDEAQISAWAKAYVKEAAALDLISGRAEGVFQPRGITTRAEAAQVLYNLLTNAGYTTLDLSQSAVEMTYSLDVLSAIELTGGDADRDGKLEEAEFQTVQASLLELLKEQLSLQYDNQPQVWNQVIRYKQTGEAPQDKMLLQVSYPPATASQTLSLTDSLYSQDFTANYVNLLTVNYGESKNTQALSGKYR
ncbi:hypothetical protein KC345_g11717, partial [Hortaea werneckii]